MARRLHQELLDDGWTWWRIADVTWHNPLDATFAARQGGRWNAPGSYSTLYLNEDRVTARMNLREFMALWPYEPEDLRAEHGPVLIGAQLPRRQHVADLHTPAGLRAARLPLTYPQDKAGEPVGHARCQSVGALAKAEQLRGLRVRSAQSPLGAGRELAWFPATTRSRARQVERLAFAEWYWA